MFLCWLLLELTIIFLWLSLELGVFRTKSTGASDLCKGFHISCSGGPAKEAAQG
jgi:hypothetical protein